MIKLKDVDIKDIRAGGVKISYATHGHVVVWVNESGSPLERHPDWTLTGLNAATHTAWNNYGNNITLNVDTATNGNQSILFKDYYGAEYTIKATVNYDAFNVNDNWILPFAKIRNNSNVVGARLNNGNIELVQRKNGIWSTLATVAIANPVGEWEVTINNNTITVKINDVVEATANHAISGDASYGICYHKIGSDMPDIISDYNIVNVTP